jgi:hypothetical protein
MNRVQFIEKATEIMKEGITFVPQANNYVIHGALEGLWELHKEAAHQERQDRVALEALILGFYKELDKYRKEPERLRGPGSASCSLVLENLRAQYQNYFNIQEARHGQTNEAGG